MDINEVIIYMDEHISEEISVEDIAKKFGFSYSHFSRKFKKKTGINAVEFLSGLKISHGIKAILDGKTIIDAQLDSGHNSSGNFSTTFKKTTGLSPREFSKRAKELKEVVQKHIENSKDKKELFYRNENFPLLISPYKLTVHIEVEDDIDGIIFCGLFSKPNPNHLPMMGRCRVKNYSFEFFNLPKGTYYPLAVCLERKQHPLAMFSFRESKRACDGSSIQFPLEKDEVMYIKLREVKKTDTPITINLPNILSSAIKQSIKRKIT